MSDYIKSEGESSFLLTIYVKPNSKKQTIVEDKDYLCIYLRSKPVQNKANKELITLLKKKLKISATQIQIISGSKNQNKIVKIDLTEKQNEQEIIKKLLG